MESYVGVKSHNHYFILSTGTKTLNYVAKQCQKWVACSVFSSVECRFYRQDLPQVRSTLSNIFSKTQTT